MMKLISFPQVRRQQREDETVGLARSLVQSFQRNLTNTFVLADGSPMNLLNAQRILCRYWEFEDQLQRVQSEYASQRAEVSVLEEEERFVSCELFLARRKLALLECPYAELDLIEHSLSGLRGWVAAVDWAQEGFLMQVGPVGVQDQPRLNENMLYLWGPADCLGWTKLGRVSMVKALKAGWMDRSV